MAKETERPALGGVGISAGRRWIAAPRKLASADRGPSGAAHGRLAGRTDLPSTTKEISPGGRKQRPLKGAIAVVVY